MTPIQGFLAALLVAVFALFLWGRLRYDVVALLALLAATLAGAVRPAEAFAGLGHPATVTVALVLILSRALQSSGAVDLMARYLLPPRESPTWHVGSLASVAGALSAVMNNVGALALLMPAVLQSAAKIGRSPAVVLMPLSFGSILGGLVTLIGTPPNIIVATSRAGALGRPFGMFDFTPVGGTVAVVGIIFIALVGWRLLPGGRRAPASARELFDIEAYVSEAVVPEGGAAAGKSLSELDDAVAEHDAILVGVIRGDRRIDHGWRGVTVREGDVLIVEAGPEGLEATLRQLGLETVGTAKAKEDKGRAADLAVMEAVVPPGARIVGRSPESLHLRSLYGVNVMAVSRQGRPFRGRLRALRFRPGDVVLLEGPAEHVTAALGALGCLPLADRGLQVGRPSRAGLSIAIFAAAILAATFGLTSLPIALAAAAAAMVLAGIIAPREVYDGIDWPVIVLLAAMIPLGGALESSGTTRLAAEAVVGAAAAAGPVAVLAIVLVVTMTLSDVINNAATAIVMAPISIDVARTLGASPDPFLMAVAIGASCAFLTPIGHQNNTLIMGAGGYRFGDYWRMGLPLEVLIVVVSIPMILLVWPLVPTP